MYSLSVENSRGEMLELSNSTNYEIEHIEGLSPPAANIISTSISGMDGAAINSSVLGMRNIVLTLNIKPPVEVNRQALYRYFQNKKSVRLYFKNNNRDVCIDGYVETFEISLFGMLQQPQISIICGDPYFRNREMTSENFTSLANAFEFPIDIAAEGEEFGTISTVATRIIDAGDIDTGGIFILTARTSQILNPTIYNITTDKSMTLNVDMTEGDVITINTKKGEKSITLLRDGATTNILNDLASGSEWLVFEAGDNEITYSADEGASNLDMTVTLSALYGGV